MRRLLLLLTPFLAGSTCDMKEGLWIETGPVYRSAEDVWKTSLTLLQETQRFQIDLQSREEGLISTKWKTQFAPIFREGKRIRAELEIIKLEKGGYNIRIRCPYEINNNSRNPMSVKDADWVPAGGEEDLAIRIKTLLRMKLRGMRLDD